jgi:hypothetical protein
MPDLMDRRVVIEDHDLRAGFEPELRDEPGRGLRAWQEDRDRRAAVKAGLDPELSAQPLDAAAGVVEA